MTETPGQLVVRQHERIQCRLSAHVRVAEESADKVAVGAGEAAGSVRELACEIIDCSAGGLGVRCATFLPKLCRVRLRLHVERGPGGIAEDIDLAARVQRVAMVDRTPTYYLGTSLTGEGDEHTRRVGLLMDVARRSAAAERSREGVAGATRA